MLSVAGWVRQRPEANVAAASLLMAASVGVGIAVLPLALVAVMAGAVVVVALVAWPEAILAAVAAVYGISATILLQYRISFGGVPIQLIDVLVILAFAAATLETARSVGGVPPAARSWWFWPFVGFFVAIEALNGLAHGAPAYGVFQELRGTVYMAMAFVATCMIVRTNARLYWVIGGLVVSGVLASAYEYQLVLTRANLNLAGGSVALRDIGVGAAIGPALLVAAFMTRAPGQLFKRWQALLLLVILVPSVPLSFTRNQWIGGIVGLIGFLLLSKRFLRSLKAVIAIAVAVVAAGAIIYAGPLAAPVGAFVQDRLAGSFSLTDATWQSRLLENTRILTIISQNPSDLVFGIGYGWLDSLDPSLEVLQSHSAYVTYLRIGGVVGLGLFGLALVGFLLAAIRGAWKSPAEGIVSATQLSVALMLIVWFVTSQAAGVLSGWATAPLVGIYFGLVVCLPSLRASNDPQPGESEAHLDVQAAAQTSVLR